MTYKSERALQEVPADRWSAHRFSGRSRWARFGFLLIPMLALPVTSALAQETPAASQPQSQPSPKAPEEPPAPTEKEGLAGLEELLQEDVPAAAVGSFGYRLRRYGISPYIHGVVTTDFWRWSKPADGAPFYHGFELRDAHLYFGADIVDLVIPEMFVEFEPPAAGGSGLRLRYAQLDLRLYEDLLVVRGGLFLVPFGTYNTQSYPRFITKLPERPELFRDIIPIPWQEVGIQLMGKWDWAPGRALSYAVYITNGLEQPDEDDPDDPTDDGVDEGGSPNDFVPAFEETTNHKKSVGARIGIDLMAGLTLGLSGYTGAYTTDGARRLNMVGLDLNLHRSAFSLEAAAAFIHQEVTGGALKKWGYNVIAAYRAHRRFEPLLAIDAVRLDGDPDDDKTSFWGGLNVYPFPEQVPTTVAKFAYSATILRGSGDVGHRIVVQLAAGF